VTHSPKNRRAVSAAAELFL